VTKFRYFAVLEGKIYVIFSFKICSTSENIRVILSLHIRDKRIVWNA